MSFILGGAAPAASEQPPALETRGLALGSPSYVRGFIDVFTTAPTEPWFARLHFDGGALEAGLKVRLPTEAAYDCLCLSGYVYYHSAMDRDIPNHCGYAYVAARDVGEGGACSVAFAHRARSGEGEEDKPLPPALGTFAFTLRGARPGAREPYPETAEAQAMSRRLIQRATRWYERDFGPIQRDLKNVHVPALPCPFFWLPGFSFAAQAPRGAEDERLFERALGAAAARRRWVLEERMRNDSDAAVLVAEAVAAIPNCQVYNEDCLVDPAHPDAPVPDEAFYADPRSIGNGDCEDQAHEVLNLLCALRRGSFASPLLRRAQEVLAGYVVAEQFAGVEMDGGKDVDRYKADSDDPNSHIFAHAFVMLLPAIWVAQALRRGGGTARLADARLGPVARQDETLTVDGIALFSARALAAFSSAKTGLRPCENVRVESMQRIGSNYYKVLSSCMVVDGAVVSAREGTPVYELGFTTALSGGHKYGAHFVDVIQQAGTVALRPTVELTAAEDAFVRRAVSYLHPIAPYVLARDGVDIAEPDLGTLERVLGAPCEDGRRLEVRRVAQPPPVEEARNEFFIQSSDALDERYLRDLREQRLPMEALRLLYRLDFFADGVFAVQVYY